MELSELRKLAQLSNLYYTDEELKGLTDTFESMKQLIDLLKNSDVSGSRVIDTIDMNDLREDVPNKSTDVDTLLMNAPEAEKGCFVVPRIVE